jgi:hypothetical protein
LGRLLDDLTSEAVNVDIVAPDGTIDHCAVAPVQIQVVGERHPTDTFPAIPGTSGS